MKLSDLQRVKQLQDRRDRLMFFDGADTSSMNVSIFGYDAGSDIVSAVAHDISQAIVNALNRNRDELAALGVTIDEGKS